MHTPGMRKDYPIAGPMAEFCGHVGYYPFDEGRFIEVAMRDTDHVEVHMWTRRRGPKR